MFNNFRTIGRPKSNLELVPIRTQIFQYSDIDGSFQESNSPSLANGGTLRVAVFIGRNFSANNLSVDLKYNLTGSTQLPDIGVYTDNWNTGYIIDFATEYGPDKPFWNSFDESGNPVTRARVPVVNNNAFFEINHSTDISGAGGGQWQSKFQIVLKNSNGLIIHANRSAIPMKTGYVL